MISNVHDLLKELSLTSDDFTTKIKGMSAAHEKVINCLRDAWINSCGFGKAKVAYSPPGGTLGIDFLGRDFERGKILIAVEVDLGWMAVGSWQKLADIRALYKIWVYVARNGGQPWFERGVQELKAFLKSRGETKEDFGNFVAFLKSPSILHMQEIFVYPKQENLYREKSLQADLSREV